MNSIAPANLDHLAPALRAARAALGWSQQQLAEACGVSLPTIVRIESGLRGARYSTVQHIMSSLSANGIELSITAQGGFRLDFLPTQPSRAVNISP